MKKSKILTWVKGLNQKYNKYKFLKKNQLGLNWKNWKLLQIQGLNWNNQTNRLQSRDLTENMPSISF